MFFPALPGRKLCLTFTMSQSLNCSAVGYSYSKDQNSWNSHFSSLFWIFGMATLHSLTSETRVQLAGIASFASMILLDYSANFMVGAWATILWPGSDAHEINVKRFEKASQKRTCFYVFVFVFVMRKRKSYLINSAKWNLFVATECKSNCRVEPA